MKKTTKKILIVYPWANIDTNPTMSLILKQLSEQGFFIDVLCKKSNDFLMPNDLDGKIRYLYESDLFYVIDGGKIAVTAARIRRFWASIKGRKRFKAIIGVDPEGLILAHELNSHAKHPLAYVSFEIFFRDELFTPREISLKDKELKASKDVSIVLVQDEERANALANENCFASDIFVLAPNSPTPVPVPSSNYLREELNIGIDKKIVLFAGSLEEWSSRDFMEEMVQNWPMDFVLVIHSRRVVNKRMQLFFDQLEQTGKIYISRKLFPQNHMSELVASADFGLAPYRQTPDGPWTGKNILHIGHSSGKVAYYALCGLPIIARDLNVYRKVFAEYDCGRVYRNTQEIAGILQELEKNYDHHSKEARRLYIEKLNPIKGVNLFCDRVCKAIS